MKKLKRKLSGMTLVEMIISIAIFAIMAMLLVLLGNAIEKNTQEANRLNSRVAVEGPIAEIQNMNEAHLVDNEAEIKVGIGQDVTDTNGDVVGKEMPSSGYSTIHGTLCYVDPELPENETASDGSKLPDTTAPENDYNFHYIAVTKPTNTTAPASTTT